MNREWTGIDRLRLDKFYMVSSCGGSPPTELGQVPGEGSRAAGALSGEGWGWASRPRHLLRASSVTFPTTDPSWDVGVP